MTKIVLKPCPFCGGPAAMEEVENGLRGVSFSVGCSARDEVACMGYQSLTTFARQSEAAEAWNRRAPADSAGTFSGATSPATTVQHTIAFIKAAHGDQVDKAGSPYWEHPVRVMNRIQGATERDRLTALLHDVLEDTGETAATLLAKNYPIDVIYDVMILTKPKEIAYPAWIGTLCHHRPSILRVKIADIEDNLDPGRLGKLDPDLRATLVAKYTPALKVLQRALEEKPL